MVVGQGERGLEMMAGRTDFNFSLTFELFTLVKNISGLLMYLKINKENLKEEENEAASETSIHFTWLLCGLQSSWLLSIDSPFSSKWSAPAPKQRERQTEESVREGGSERGSWCHLHIRDYGAGGDAVFGDPRDKSPRRGLPQQGKVVFTDSTCLQRIDAFKLWCWRRFLRVPGTAGRSNQSILKECEELTYWKRPWCWEELKAEEKGTKEDKMVGWHHRLNGHEFEQAPGDGEG